MLMYGSPDMITSVLTPNTVVFNMSSLIEGYPNLYLIPPNTNGHTYDREFDMYYYQFIMSNNQVFASFFRIIQALYIGRDVYIIIGNDEWCDNLCQSLMKMIQQRYGYNGYFIGSPLDYVQISILDQTGFNQEYGLYNLDQDKDRYALFVKQQEIKAGNAEQSLAIVNYYELPPPV